MSTTTESIEVRIQTRIPPGLLEMIRSTSHGKYTDFRHIFHCIQTDTDVWLGVAGDGNNGAYEWFIFHDLGSKRTLETSDCGYGDTAVALREVLLGEVR